MKTNPTIIFMIFQNNINTLYDLLYKMTRNTGQVKWFNNRAGYGFITMFDNDQDVFTHYSTLKVGDSQYKYLVQGEYVEFDLVTSTNTEHEVQAVNVTGIRQGPLMCETRQTNQPPKRRKQDKE